MLSHFHSSFSFTKLFIAIAIINHQPSCLPVLCFSLTPSMNLHFASYRVAPSPASFCQHILCPSSNHLNLASLTVSPKRLMYLSFCPSLSLPKRISASLNVNVLYYFLVVFEHIKCFYITSFAFAHSHNGGSGLAGHHLPASQELRTIQTLIH